MGYVESLLGRNERIVHVARQHWVVLLSRILLDLGIAVVIIAIAVGLSLIPALFPWSLIVLILLLIPIIHFLVRFLSWHNQQYVITNRRIIAVAGVVDKHVSDSSLEKVNDVGMDQSALGRILGYGDLEIISGADIGMDIFRRIARPIHFKTEMVNQKEALGALEHFEMRAGRVLTTEAPGAGDIPELIAELDELRQKGLISDAEFEEQKAKLLARL